MARSGRLEKHLQGQHDDPFLALYGDPAFEYRTTVPFLKSINWWIYTLSHFGFNFTCFKVPLRGKLGMTSIVEVRNLQKRYPPARGAKQGTLAVKNVSLTLERGEIFSLLGPNGAGKTTLISMMSGLLTPTAGDVLIDGHSIVKEPVAVKKLIGVVPQEIALYPQLSARQNLEFFGKLYGLSGSDLARRCDEVLDFIGLTDRQNERIESYSGGMKRRVNIGVGLLHRPQLVFMDEPTVGNRSAKPPQHPGRGKNAQPAGHDRPLHDALHGRSTGTLESRRHF